MTDQASLEDGIAVSQVLHILKRHSRWILGGAVVAGLTTLVLMVTLVRPVYLAKATIMISPTSIRTALAPNTLSVQAYQRLLESDAVVAEARQRLLDAGVAIEGDDLVIGEDLRSRIFVDQREQRSLAPILELTVEAHTAKAAAAIANTWAAAFLEQTKGLLLGTTGAAVRFVEEQYPQSSEGLRRLEERRRQLADEFGDRRVAAAFQWDQRRSVAKAEIAQRVAGYQAETRKLFEDVVRGAEEALARGEGQVAEEDRDEYLKLLVQLTAIRRQLAQASPILTLEKAMSDEALWLSLGLESIQESASDPLGGKGLVTEEANPAYQELALQAVETEVLLRQAAGAASALASVTALELARVQEERAAGLDRLRIQSSLELAQLARQQETELQKLDREAQTRLQQVGRKISQLEGLDELLAESFNQTILAKAQEEVDQALLAAPAVPPVAPESPRLPVKVLMASFLGGFLGLLLGMLREEEA